jgi:DNA repair protein RadD
MNDLSPMADFNLRPLRPYQQAAIDQLKDKIRSGKKRVALILPTGGGKTLIASHIVAGALTKGGQAVFCAPMITLIDQTIAAFETEGIHDIGAIQAKHPRTRPMARVQVASVQTLQRRDDLPKASVVIVDECFVAGTMVATPLGGRPIESIAPGDLVVNAIGVGLVTATTAKTSMEIIEVEFDDGTRIKCTENHPFLTASGWIEAGSLGRGQSVVGIENMRELWSGNEAGKKPRRAAMDGTEGLLDILLKEVEKPYAHTGVSTENGRYIAENTASSEDKGGQRQGHDCSAESLARRAWSGLDWRACSAGLEGRQAGWASGSLQDRHSQFGADDCNRGGRRQSRVSIAQGARREEGRVPSLRRVVSVSHQKCESPVPVYNLQVTGHPSYFANGALVHNCHVFSQVIADWMQERPDLVFVGLTATPGRAGMGEEYQDIVVAITTKELIEQGYLSKFTVYAASKPDMSGVKIVNGDYQTSGAEEVMTDKGLVGDILRTYLLHGEDRPTLGFAVSVNHAKYMAAQFTEAGIPSAFVEAKTDTLERKSLQRQFRNGDLRVIWSVRTMTTGVDLPVSGIIDAAPTRSAMLHQQKIGRGLRVNEGTEDLKIWDHAGNTLRLGFVDDLDWSELPRGKRGEVQPKRKEPLPKECPECGYLMEPKVKCCPDCGHERKPPSGFVETAEGELVPLNREVSRQQVPVHVKQSWYAQLIGYAVERGYKPGWAFHKYREKFGVEPSTQFSKLPEPPSVEVCNWIKSRAIAHAKAKAKAA